MTRLDERRVIERRIEIVAGQATTIDGLGSGRYEVMLSKRGFSRAVVVVDISDRSPIVAVGDLFVTLENLAEARLNLSGARLSGCDLRSGRRLVGSDLTRTNIHGALGAILPGQCPSCSIGHEAACQPLDLRQSDLSGADLTGVTDAQGTHLAGKLTLG